MAFPQLRRKANQLRRLIPISTALLVMGVVALPGSVASAQEPG
jgi:hypothetical protein